jgi:hypothetical protein
MCARPILPEAGENRVLIAIAEIVAHWQGWAWAANRAAQIVNQVLADGYFQDIPKGLYPDIGERIARKIKVRIRIQPQVQHEAHGLSVVLSVNLKGDRRPGAGPRRAGSNAELGAVICAPASFKNEGREYTAAPSAKRDFRKSSRSKSTTTTKGGGLNGGPYKGP